MNPTSFDSQTGRRAFWEKADKEMRALIDPATGKVFEHMVHPVPCSVCGEHRSSPLFRKLGFQFVRCEQCDTVYVNPQLKPEATLEYYRAEQDERSSISMWMDVLKSEQNQSWQRPYFEDAVELIRKFVPGEGGKLLDLGCSIGFFMQVAQSKGFDCIGIELEIESRQYAKSIGLDVRETTLDQAGFADETFDVVTMFGVLEHLQYPQEVLRDVYRCLKPGGVIMAIVPNVGSLAASVLHEQAKMFNGRNHLTYFSWKTLPEIFTRAGFVVHKLDSKLTAMDSVVNHLQFLDPQGDPETRFLPPAVQELISNPEERTKVERMIEKLGLGLRLRILVTKPA